MFSSFHRRLLFLLLPVLVTGCAGLPVTGQLPEGVRVEQVASSAVGAPFAPSPDGSRLAFGRAGLQLLDLASRSQQALDSETPAALAWSADGTTLAAAFHRERESRVQLYTVAGTKGATVRVAGRVAELRWLPTSELLVATDERTTYSFGINFNQALLRWNGTEPPTAVRLHDATVQPGVQKLLGNQLDHFFTLSLSPQGDEVAYTRLQSPPEFATYLRVILRSLDSGTEREVANVSLLSGGALFDQDGERLLVGDGTAATVWYDPWSSTQLATLPPPGRSLALAGDTLLIDGRLYRGTTEIAAFPSDSVGLFAARGTLLFLRQGTSIYRIAGLPAVTTPQLDPARQEKLRELRSWRAKGLISAADYQSAKERILKNETAP